MKTATLLALAAAGLIALGTPHADAAERTARRGAVETADGGVAGKAVGYSGPHGDAGVRGHGVMTDGKGDATAVSGAAGRTANGGTYGRAGKTTVGADGSISHRSGAAATGPNGSGKTAGSFTRNPDGSYGGQRSTSANGANGGAYAGNTTYANGSGTHTSNATAANGETYSGETTWSKGQGATHTGTCKDASGTVIPCR